MISGKARSALIWAAEAHQDQVRKSTKNSLSPNSEVPYIIHLVSVMNIISQAGGTRNMICAACLHDIVEDSSVTIDQVEDEFGKEVASLVLSVTKTDAIDNLAMNEKAAAIFTLCQKTAGVDGLALKSADLLANLSDLVWEIEESGLGAASKLYGKDRWQGKINHYLNLADLLTAAIKNEYPELAKSLLARVFELKALLNN